MYLSYEFLYSVVVIIFYYVHVLFSMLMSNSIGLCTYVKAIIICKNARSDISHSKGSWQMVLRAWPCHHIVKVICPDHTSGIFFISVYTWLATEHCLYTFYVIHKIQQFKIRYVYYQQD